MLQGTFETLALPELLGLLAGARKTGALRLEAGPVSGVVHLEDGHCRAVETAEYAGRVQDGPALLTRLVDVCFAVTREESGAFRFVSDEPAPWRSDEPAELSDALVEVDRLLKQWHEILCVIPSLECRVRLLEVLEVDEIVVNRDRWALLVGIDGHRSAQDLVQRAGRPVMDVCQSLLELVEAGGLEVLDPAEATPVPVPTASAPTTPAPTAPAPTAPAPTAPAPTAPAPTAPAPTAPAPTAPAPTAPAPQPGVPPSAPAARAATTPAPAPAPAALGSTFNGPTSNDNGSDPRTTAAEPSEDYGGETPDRGAFLRLFSGLRDG